MPSATDYLRRQHNIPSELRSKEWSRVNSWIRERAFFMASVANAKELHKWRNVIEKVTAGQMSASQARKTMRLYLDSNGYSAETGLKGTIKDRSTWGRMKVSIDTNVAMARGWAQRQQMLGDIGNPGQRLYRARNSRQPRDWNTRWREAAEAVQWQGVARDGSFIALTTSPIWEKLSAFGNPYPPFDWGSGMNVIPVSFDECDRLGLVDDKMFEDIDKASLESLNEAVEITPDISDRALRDELAEALQGIAEWKGEKLVLTDPNGSRPYAWNDIGRVISTPNLLGIPLYQANAFRQWTLDSRAFAPPEAETGVPTVSRDTKEDMIRLINRIEPVQKNGATDKSAETVLRGLKNASEDAREDLLKRIRNNGYGARPGYIAESWTPSMRTASEFSASSAPVILVCSKYRSRKRIDDIYRHVDDTEPAPHKPKRVEGESLFPSAVRFRYKGSEKKGNILYVYVEEM